MTEKDRQMLMIAVAAGSVIISRVPFIGKYFRGIYTLVHEMGHAMVAVVTSGKLISVELFSNTEGRTSSALKSGLSRFLVSLAGYTLASVTAFIFALLISRKQEVLILYTILIINVVCLFLFVRNIYGVIWLLIMSALCAGTLYYHQEAFILGLACGLSTLILWDSVSSVLFLGVLSIRESKAAGDAGSLKEITHIPAVFWAMLFILNSFYWAGRSLQLFFPALKILSL